MRDSISRYTSEIEATRTRLDSNVERISGVSRALTTTTGGVAALEHEVVRIAAAIAGEGSSAVLVARVGDRLASRAAFPAGVPLTQLERWESLPVLLGGSVVRESQPGVGSLLAVPMFYQDAVVGALVLAAAADVPAIPEDVEDVLVVLANNTAIAMENARLFEQERETVRRLRQLDAMKTDFLSTVQHELRTPLTAILGLSDLIEMCWDMWEDGPKLEAVRDIQVAARNLYDIVETIIDFSAVDGEAVILNPVALPLGEAVAKAVELVGERYKGGLPIPVDVDVEPQLTIQADAERFSQVIRAVVDNAVKFSDGKGRVTVRAAVMPAWPDQVHIEITDEGVGIPSEDIPRIFERFFQVDNTATRRYGGTGMGLALVKRLVQAHGARVDVTSSMGKGTCVSLLWPATSDAAAAEVAATASAAPGNGQSSAHVTTPAAPVS
jgi:signal transduction histidine kinase